MTESLAASAIEPMTESFTSSQDPFGELILEPPSAVAATSCEGGANSQFAFWRPDEPQFTRAIARNYGVSRKTVQEWFQKVKEACPWFSADDLKLPDGRYTPLCIELMGDYRLAGLPFKAWKARIWEQNPDLVAAYETAHPQPVAGAASTSSETTAIVLKPSEIAISVPQVDTLNLMVLDSTHQLTQAITSLDATLQQFVSNEQTLEEALKQNATQKGRRLGTELAITEIGNLVQAQDAARVELAKKLGLVATSDNPPSLK